MRLSGWRRWPLMGLLGASLGLAGCGGLPAPPALSDAEVLATPDYQINPADTVKVFVWRAPELSVTVPVRPDGRISLPLVDDLQAAGRTPTELARAIEQELSPFVQNPRASVVIEQFADNLAETVQIMGEVKKPTAVAYRPRLTVLDVVVAAGGLTEFADGDSAKLIRRDQSGERAYQLDLQQLVVNGELSKNAKLRPGDLIVVPQSLL